MWETMNHKTVAFGVGFLFAVSVGVQFFTG